jgi:hypothetical protein
MSREVRSWIASGLPPGAYDALASGLSASRLWSLLLEVLRARAAARGASALVEQWDRDRFVQLSVVDQRRLHEVDRHVLAAASAYEAIELSPVAPLGTCSIMGRTSQNKILSALRGTEVVADPTNVMALEAARRLRRDASSTVRLATSHRCVRAQEIPKVPGFTANFRIFSLASAGFERPNHAFVAEAVTEQIRIMLDALDRCEQHGFVIPERRVTLLARPDRAELADRIAGAIDRPGLTREVLDHPYYDGLRFQIATQSSDASEMTLIDGGVLDWVAKLMSDRRAVYVASGLGSQRVALWFRQQ